MATFSLLLERDLLRPDDPMAIPGRVANPDAAFRMPKAGSLAPQEIQRIGRFSRDLADALRSGDGDRADPPDERFPDSLLLPYDGEERDERVPRRMSYFQLRRSFATLFGPDWLAASGPDPFKRKASAFGGADFRSSFETSRTMSASYLAAIQQTAREVARRYVSAPKDALFAGFDPDVSAAASRRRAKFNVKTLYERIAFRAPSAAETERAVTLVRRLQRLPSTDRKVRFSLEVEDGDGRRDRQEIDVTLRATGATVSRFQLDQTRALGDASSWLRVGNAPFRFEAGNPHHFVRLVARPGNHVTAFDAVKPVRVEDGVESPEAVILDNLDAECLLSSGWEPVAKDGERSRAGDPKKKYGQNLHVIGSSHVETRTLESRLEFATMALRIPADGAYNVYLSWPAIPGAAPAATVEVHAADGQPGSVPANIGPARPAGLATVFLDQTESTLDEDGQTQWQRIQREVLLAKESDYVQISNRGVDSTRKVIVADAVKFTPLGDGPAIVIDNSSPEGFEAAEGWAPDQLSPNLPGRGKMFGEDILHYPPSKSGNPLKDYAVDPAKRVWARYRPVVDGRYRPGWYSVSVWAPGGHTHAGWVPFEIRASEFAPVAAIEPPPVYHVGETATLNASATYHPAGSPLSYRWTHNARDLNLRLEAGASPTPRFAVPSLRSARPGWAGLIEALLQAPEFLMPAADPGAAPRARLARVALDLMGRIPTQAEFRRFEQGGRLGPLVDSFLASDDFRDFFFHRARTAFRSRGTEESDEPARLWTYLAINDISYRDLFTADYTVGPDWRKASRRPEHGPTGILTMKGYLVGRPGLPKYTYPAQVLTFALGLQFEVTDAVEQAREKVVSTTDPASMCYSCHKLLTPLAFQRERWDVQGNHRTVDADQNPIDDSDRGVVPDYPFKGAGLSAFSTQVIAKERFVRAFVNQHHDMLFHRRLRLHEDQRSEYRDLYDFALANDLKIRPLLKRMILAKYEEPSGRVESARAGRVSASTASQFAKR